MKKLGPEAGWFNEGEYQAYLEESNVEKSSNGGGMGCLLILVFLCCVGVWIAVLDETDTGEAASGAVNVWLDNLDGSDPKMPAGIIPAVDPGFEPVVDTWEVINEQDPAVEVQPVTLPEPTKETPLGWIKGVGGRLPEGWASMTREQQNAWLRAANK